MKNQYDHRKQSGMTLVEIMIALLIGAFLIAGVLQIFINTKQTYRMQEGLSRLQENGRFAMDFISRDVRTTDYWGCADSTNIENKLNADATFDPFAIGLAAQNDDNGGNDGDADNDENGNNIWDGTDSITLRGATGLGISLTADPAILTSPLAVANNSGLAADDFVVISDCVSGDIFQITGVAAGDTISHGNGNAGELGNASTALGTGNPDSAVYVTTTNPQIYKLNFATYEIRNGAGNQPALFRSINGGNFQELVEGIEDMQILYGEDTDADGSPNYFVAAGTAGLNMDQVVGIRISLLVTSTDDNLTSQPIDYIYPYDDDPPDFITTTTPTDRRMRRVFTSTIALRNRLQ